MFFGVLRIRRAIAIVIGETCQTSSIVCSLYTKYKSKSTGIHWRRYRNAIRTTSWVYCSTIIPCGSYQYGSLVCLCQGLLHSYRVGVCAYTHTYNICTVLCCIVYTSYYCCYVAGTIALHNCHRHNKSIGVGTHYSYTVVCHCCRYTCTVCAVAVKVVHIAGLVHKVVAMYIIVQSVSVIVLVFCTVGFGSIGPYIVSQIGMIYIHTCIYYGNNFACSSAVQLRLLQQLVQSHSGKAPLCRIQRVVGSKLAFCI